MRFFKVKLEWVFIKVNIKDSSIGIKENYIGIDKIDVNLNLIKFLEIKILLKKYKLLQMKIK